MLIKIKCYYCPKVVASILVQQSAEPESFTTEKHQCTETAINGAKFDVLTDSVVNIKPKANDA